MIAIRRKLGLPDRDPTGTDGHPSMSVHVPTDSSPYKKAAPSFDHRGGHRGGTRSTPGMLTGLPPPPDEWVWPAEGEHIDVEVAVRRDMLAVWAAPSPARRSRVTFILPAPCPRPT